MLANPGNGVGLVLGSAIPPEDIPDATAMGERGGFSEVWLAEDYFFTGGVAGATAALAATKRVPVGTGIVSAMVRHPAVLAMEASTIARMFPGRFMPGVGLGVPAWIHQMGLTPVSQLAALRECITAVRRLLDGEEITEHGKVFTFDKVKLTYPLDAPVPLYMGAIGPNMLRLSGELCNGTVGSVLAGPKYVEWARRRIAEGAVRGTRKNHHRFVAFAIYSVDKDSGKAKRAVRDILAFYLATVGPGPMTAVYNQSERVAELIAAGGARAVSREMPPEWLDDWIIAGDPDECAARIRALHAAGADCVALFPMPVESSRTIIENTAKDVLPRLS